MTRSGVFLLISLALAFLGCPKDEPPQEDRALRILQAEKEREEKGLPPPVPPPAPRDDPNQPLAQLAAGSDAAESELPLPKNNPTFYLGALALKLAGLSSSHGVGSGKIHLSSEDLFLRVHLLAQNVGKQPGKFDLAFARLMDVDGHSYAVARDAQRVGGSRELDRLFPVNERQDLVLYFEVPNDAPGKRLRLILPQAVGGPGDVSIPLE